MAKGKSLGKQNKCLLSINHSQALHRYEAYYHALGDIDRAAPRPVDFLLGAHLSLRQLPPGEVFRFDGTLPDVIESD